MHHDTEADPPPQLIETQAAQLPPRRSSRLASRLAGSPQQAVDVSATMSEPSRNPKRKASEAANHVTAPPDKLLDEALAPLTSKDVQEWEGWIELESEPAFFNIILRDLGVKHVKAQEIFTIDQDSLDILPKPVLGLIFLFQYVPGHDDVDQDEDTSDVWFANQTTDNACATIALLNIIMNADGIDLGQNLRDFKESTKHLSTPLRGHQLSRNTFIRTIHNSFTRRMDHLNADLCLENEASEASSKKVKKRAAPKKGRKTTRKKKVKPEYGFHFIAYVPAGGYVWELDGLKSKPHRLDAVSSGDWTSIARPQIEGRMLQYEESQLSFNLLALCQSPLAAHSQAIARAVASLRHLHAQLQACSAFTELVAAEPSPLDIDDESRLSEFNLSKLAIIEAEVPEGIREKCARTDLETSDAYALHQELVIEVKAAMGEYRAELVAIADDEQRVKGRKKDYGPALHKWVKKLAEKGVLEDAIKSAA
ncbi:hypothetical protein BGZ61DRAFT_350599 [Ilyonectria robusta]|uniref:uncharacterized protein n=1 Tax=Ilyonectria robusta TaxID=1079257 RepID=UPI001E8E459B|nr:uncharacterized protein BGZ61DRAFT_350599 [Ilyonectria robusta]KAH8706793.1 hypothetical protein BGZ61DRAFT_350599 [Ilyonectria robusta]